MFDNQDNMQDPLVQDIPVGTTVYDMEGEKLGTVAEQNPQGGYLLVQKGWLFHKDFYVPLNAIARVDLDGVYLRLTKDDLQHGQYDNPPIDSAANDATTEAFMRTGYAPTTIEGSDLAAPYTTTEDVNVAGVRGDSTVGNYDRDARGADETASGDIRIPVREEELVVGKRQAEEGRVHLHKEVIEEQETLTVPVERERVTVERLPLSGDVDPSMLREDTFTDRDIDVPVMGEEVELGKRVRGVEEVRVHKNVVTETEEVSDTVRKERVVVDGADGRDATYADGEGRTVR